MKNLYTLILSAFVIVAGCAQQPSVDTTPKNPTAVLNANFSISGFIMPDSTGVQTVYTRGDRRRIESTREYDSWASRRMLGNGKLIDIARTDKNVMWSVDEKRKQYRECPLTGCKFSIWDSLAQGNQAEEDDEDYFDPSEPEACSMETKQNSFDVTPIEGEREINGFMAKRYQAKWTRVTADQQGREDRHALVMDFWMSDVSEDMTKGWAINEQFQNNYLDRVTEKASPMARFVSRKGYKALAMFSGDIDKSDTSVPGLSKLNQLEGYPISIKLEWFMDTNACPEAKEQEENNDIDLNSSIEGLAAKFLKDKVKEKVAKKFTPDPDKPIFRYIYDVTSAEILQVHDSIFEIPNGYKISNRD